MNKEIEEIVQLLEQDCDNDKILSCKECKYCKETFCVETFQAEALYNAGYRKIVWHKVADGDFPPREY